MARRPARLFAPPAPRSLGSAGRCGRREVRTGGRRSLGRQFGWLWAAYAVSAYGSGFGFGAFPLIAILVLHAGPAEVSALAAAGLAVGAVVAVPLGPWVEFRRKRPVMMAMDLTRFAALMSVPGRVRARLAQLRPAAGGLGHRRRGQDRVQRGQRRLPEGARAAGGPARGERPVRVHDVDRHRGRAAARRGRDRAVRPGDHACWPMRSATCSRPRGSARSAAGAASGPNQRRRGGPARSGGRVSDLLDGWRYILANPGLRPVFFNRLLVDGLIMATEPLLAVLMLGQLHFAPWQYGLAFAAPCVRRPDRLTAGPPPGAAVRAAPGHASSLARCAPAGRSGWPSSRPGVAGLVLVIVVQFGLVTCMGVFNPVLATYRLDQTASDRVARTLSAWSVSSSPPSPR